jgi:hypothetical protein
MVRRREVGWVRQLGRHKGAGNNTDEMLVEND